jgi:hypothetical protein
MCTDDMMGVIMDEKMNFSENVDVMVGKAFAMLGFIRSLFVRSWSTPAVLIL